MHTNTIPKTVMKWIQANEDKVEEYHVEADEYGEEHQGDFSVWCYLKPGFKNQLKDVHCIHAATAKDFLEQAGFVSECNCEERCNVSRGTSKGGDQ